MVRIGPPEWIPLLADSVSIVLLVAVAVVVALAVLANAALTTAALGGGSGSSTPKRNCPGCGARTPADEDACHYCDHPLPADPESDASG